MKSISRNTNGVALITVLACLVIIAVLVLAFFASATHGRISSQLYRGSEEARKLSEHALSLAMAQIQQGADQGTNRAWASQPGAIRVFDESAGLVSIYKLYSAPSMVVASVADLASDVPPAAWDAAPGKYSDLNEPIFDGRKFQFPVVDPRAYSLTNPVAGFRYNGTLNGTVLPGDGNRDDQRLPMPVPWLYLLADGSLIAPQAIPGGVRVPGADRERKQIIGRIAFWTDDDTCKVNLNTASHGNYWDVPRVDTTADRAYASNQPRNGEFQSYPGHPAATDLKAVFPGLADEQIFTMAPRISSRGEANDADRLYASVDEVLFDMDRAEQSAPPADIGVGRFFLTAHSRAPELNLFNQPRISLWPVSHRTGPYRTAYDNLAEFCATLDGHIYGFQRADPHSNNEAASLARNWQILQYLDRLGSKTIPGFGGAFVPGKYSEAGFRQILTEIFDYVRTTNLRDSSLADATKGFAVKRENSVFYLPEGQVTPTYIPAWGTKGFGRFPTVSEAFLWFVAVGGGPGQVPSTAQRSLPGTTEYPYRNNISQGPLPPPNSVEVLCLFGLQYFDPSNGWSDIRADFGATVEGLNGFKIKTGMGVSQDWTPLEMPSSGSWRTTFDNFMAGFAPWGGVMDYRANWYGVQNFTASSRAAGFGPYLCGRDSILKYPNYSRVFNAPRGGMMDFRGGPITIKLYSLDQNKNLVMDDEHLVQTITMEIPDGQFPSPVPAADGSRRNVGIASNSRLDPWGKGAGTDILAPGTDDAAVQDVVHSVAVAGGDQRLIAGKRVVAKTDFQPSPNYGTPTTFFAHALGTSYLGSSTVVPGMVRGKLVENAAYPAKWHPAVGGGVNGALDWDNGLGNNVDGAYINKPDEGNTAGSAYFNPNFAEGGTTLFSPNRQVASPAMLGSLPAGVLEGTPWRTLQFRPFPTSHPGLRSPRDHLLMDWFWMPMVEPYAISESFSTAGKINMNYAMAPFTHLTRNTGIRAVLATEKMLCIPDSAAANYKSGGSGADYRVAMNVDETLKGFEGRFLGGEIFRSATEICDLPLVPDLAGATQTDMGSFWETHRLTGDNSKERPYATIYPRLTTKSNTYTVHMRVQSLKIPLSGNPEEVLDKQRAVSGEWRGYSTVERYLDPRAPSIPDIVTAGGSLSSFYRMRILETKNLRP